MTELRVETLPISGAPLQGENPLPFFRHPQVNIPVRVLENVPEAKGAYFGWQAGFRARPPYRIQEGALENFVLRGGGLLTFHNSGWRYPWQRAYRHMLGGYYRGHPCTAEFSVSVVEPKHPITKDVQPFTIQVGLHWLWFDYDRVNLLLVSQGKDGRKSAAGWVHGQGSGRVAFLANGHTVEIHRHPQFVKRNRKVSRWLVRIGEHVGANHP